MVSQLRHDAMVLVVAEAAAVVEAAVVVEAELALTVERMMK